MQVLGGLMSALRVHIHTYLEVQITASTSKSLGSASVNVSHTEFFRSISYDCTVRDMIPPSRNPAPSLEWPLRMKLILR